jgi:hypothetical protein
MVDDPTDITWRYRDETWSKQNFTYSPPRIPFLGRQGPRSDYGNGMPTFLHLFDLFWPYSILRKIVCETNRYAMESNGEGSTVGGPTWEVLTIAGLKAFMAVQMYMGMKKQPNMKSYWQRMGSFLHCPFISKMFTRDHFYALRRCLHITNPASYNNVERGTVGFDKLRQVRWLVEAIRENCKKVWALGKYLTIDEMMVRYKGTYSPIRQYMPNKPQKWGLKIWCLADAVTKYVYDFSVYCGKILRPEGAPVVPPTAGGLAHNVVMGLMEGLENRGHVVMMDNYFSSVGLFEELASKGIYATRTMRTNRIGLPAVLKDTKTFNRNEQGHMDWRMHEGRGMSTVLWKDKRPVLLLSTSAAPIGFPCVPVHVVPRRSGSVREMVFSNPMHVEYTTHMRGVDVADQLRASYSSQTRSHKWWHRVWNFLLDVTVVNMYIMYLSILARQRVKKRPMTHLQFKTTLCAALTLNWEGRAVREHGITLANRPSFCMPSYHKKRRYCSVCKMKKTNFFCYQHECRFMCLKRGCYQIAHTPGYRFQ